MVKILGHRGARSERPENTIVAFERANALGADGIETDVHMLFDGSLAVYHDAKVALPGGAERSIYTYDKNSLGDIDVGGEKAPFFEEALAYFKTTDLFLNIEIKNETGFIYPLEDRIIPAIEKFGLSGRCLISTFKHDILFRIRQKYPRYKLGALYGRANGFDVVSYCKKHRLDAVHPHFTDVDADFVKKCRQNGISVNVWTVNAPEDIKRMIACGVDSLITDDVAAAKRALAESGGSK